MGQAADMNAWRSWAVHASPELLEQFDRQSGELMREIRRKYPPDCGPSHPQYQDLKCECSRELRHLTERIDPNVAVN